MLIKNPLLISSVAHLCIFALFFANPGRTQLSGSDEEINRTIELFFDVKTIAVSSAFLKNNVDVEDASVQKLSTESVNKKIKYEKLYNKTPKIPSDTNSEADQTKSPLPITKENVSHLTKKHKIKKPALEKLPKIAMPKPNPFRQKSRPSQKQLKTKIEPNPILSATPSPLRQIKSRTKKSVQEHTQITNLVEKKLDDIVLEEKSNNSKSNNPVLDFNRALLNKTTTPTNHKQLFFSKKPERTLESVKKITAATNQSQCKRYIQINHKPSIDMKELKQIAISKKIRVEQLLGNPYLRMQHVSNVSISQLLQQGTKLPLISNTSSEVSINTLLALYGSTKNDAFLFCENG